METRREREGGFTLVELLAVLGIMGILMAISSQSYQVYKVNAYNSITDQVVRQIKTDIESGQIENDFMDNWGFAWAHATAKGSVTNGTMATELLPSYQNPEDVEVWVSHDAWCAMGILGDFCVTDWISARHCKGDKNISYSRMRNGTEWTFEWNGGAC